LREKVLSSPIVNKTDVNHLLEIDSNFSIIKSKYGLPPNWSRPTGFISLSQIILEQQVSLASAKAHFIKLNKYLGKFTPANILKLSDAEMRECQISRQKTVYLRELSKNVLEKNIFIDKLHELDETQIRTELTKIKGIGHWTTDIYLMFCLQSKDVFPIGDIAVVNTIKELYKADNREKILKLSQKWKPFRSLATYFIWHYYLCKRNRTA
jgi:DNA-3-methyladenine glycosylase II